MLRLLEKRGALRPFLVPPAGEEASRRRGTRHWPQRSRRRGARPFRTGPDCFAIVSRWTCSPCAHGGAGAGCWPASRPGKRCARYWSTWACPDSRRGWPRPRGPPERMVLSSQPLEPSSPRTLLPPTHCRGQARHRCAYSGQGRDTGPANGSDGTRQQHSFPSGPWAAPPMGLHFSYR